jgi:Bacterial Ig domain
MTKSGQPPAVNVGRCVVAGLLLALITDAAAFGQESRCRARYRFIWGQNSQGIFSTQANTTCRVNLRMRGLATLASARIIEGPKNGTAATSNDGTIRFQPKSGFTGSDSMTVRYTGTSRGIGEPKKATVTFAITVY